MPLADGNPDRVWTRPAARTRARWNPDGDRRRLFVGPYTPVEDMLPPAADTLVARAITLFGKPASAVLEAFPGAQDHFKKGKTYEVSQLIHPATSPNDFDALKLILEEGSVVTELYLRLDLPPGEADKVLALATRRLGPATLETLGAIKRYTHTHAGLTYMFDTATDASPEDLHLHIKPAL